MALGFSDGVGNRIPDRTMSKRTTPSTFNYGVNSWDQRAPSGINTLVEEYSISFNHRLKADIDDIAAFFDSTNGANNFNFTVPDTSAGGIEKTIKVVVTEYNLIYEYDNFYSLNATFRRVYVP